MNFKKRASKSVALALVGLTVVIPAINNVSAMEKQQNTIDGVSSITEGVEEESENISEEEFERKVEELNIYTTEESETIVLEKLDKIEQEGFKYEKNKGLSDEEIDKRYAEISEKYDLFEKVSEEDEEFILAYQNIFKPINQESKSIETRGIDQNKTIKTVQKASQGVTAKVSGSLRHKGGSAWNFKNSYGGSVYFNIVGGASKVRKVTGQIIHEAWGIAGEGGVIKVYDGKIEYVKDKAPFAQSYVNRDQPYTAYVSAMKTYAYMIIDHSAGQFDITAGV